MRADLPTDVARYAESPLFDEQTVPEKLTSAHELKAGTWGRICVSAGALEYHVPGNPHQACDILAGEYAVIEPEQVHFVKPVGHVLFKVEFYREP